LSNLEGKKVLLIANSAWNLWNFRLDLIRALYNERAEVLCAAPADDYQHKLTQAVNVRFLPLNHLTRKGIAPIENILGYYEIWCLLRREKPDLLLVYTIKPIIFGHFAAIFSPEIRIVTTYEGLGYLASANAWLKRLSFSMLRIAFNKSQKVIFLNRENQNLFLKKKVVRTEKTQLIKGIGIDIQHFAPNGSLNAERRECIFLYVGRLLVDKGIRDFVAAAVQVKKQHPGTRFQILGKIDPGNPLSISASELKRWVEQNSIDYLGSTDDVRPFIHKASVIVLPSYREGLSRVLLEALALAKPIITSDRPGCYQTVDDGVNGLIFPAGNIKALVACMIKMAGFHTDTLHEMGRHSRKKAEAEFSNEIILPQYLKTIAEAMKKDEG
jgi:glycosyltransferase involved in cell wall biosynthesis